MKIHVPASVPPALLSLLLIVMAVSTATFITSCSRKSMTPDQASEWISAYTPAHIDMDSKIRIEMTEAMRAKVDSSALLARCFTFSPSVKGTATLSADGTSIDFTPEAPLKQGRSYRCRLDMASLTGVDSLADFTFDFRVERRDMALTEVEATVDPYDTSRMTISGVIEYSTPAGAAATADSSIIVCDHPGARVIVDSRSSHLSRRFRIHGIKRQTGPSQVRISTNPLLGFSKAEEIVDIPSIADFRLISAERVEASEPYINLNFSSPLSREQDLDGLITIDRVDELKIRRDGCNVKVYYPSTGIKDLTLRISDALRNGEGRPLGTEVERRFEQQVIAPALEMPFEGSILPDNSNLRLPFRAVNLAAVDVEVVKVFPANVMHYLQETDLDGTGELRRFGRLIYRKTVRLDRDKSIDLHQWQDFSIDLKDLFHRQRGAVYNVRLSFRRAYSLYDRTEAGEFEEVDGITPEDDETWSRNHSYIYRDNPDNDWEHYSWRDCRDPSTVSYYMDYDMPECNLVASTLGLIVKKGADNRYLAAVTDLITAAPAPGVRVDIYDYQLRRLASATTDAGGFATLPVSTGPYMVTATDGQSTTYIKLPMHDLPTEGFDTDGLTMTDGVKGFVYGDRGVWCPGDDVHLTLILEDKDRTLPSSHPVVLELTTPDDRLHSRLSLSRSIDGFYTFHIPTEISAPTGTWTAKFKVGNQTFTHPVRIETIKPNRLKVNIQAPAVIQANTPQSLGIDARWLTGPVASGMSATMEMTLYSNPKPFPQYKNFTFANPLVDFSSSTSQILTGRLDSLGSLNKPCTIGTDINAPGMLMANLTAKVTEPGGEASITSRSVALSPFGVYVGIDAGKGEYMTDTDLRLPVVVVNQNGARMKSRRLAYKIYRLENFWWMEGRRSNFSRYISSPSVEVVASDTITVTGGRGAIPFRVDYPDWGKYLVVVRDIKGGHATGGTFSVDWPSWRGRASQEAAGGSTQLAFTLDKDSYTAGETAQVYLPKCRGGRVLLSIENGTKVLRRYWVATSASGQTCFRLPVTGDMAPNFYVTATLLRPHAETSLTEPIRLFGVQGASVVDKRTILHPVIDMPGELHPGQTFTLSIKEKDNKPMTYTVALVDEGLLDITNFKTPRPWEAMNRKEALGVKTWDMFDDVIGAFGSNFRSVLSVGGDEALRKSAGKEKRFNPVVRFLGPFTLRGGSSHHKITMPNYVGSVRVMVVAAHEGTYGHADKTVAVTSELMLLTTLPPVLACGDALDVPVNVFAMRDDIRDVALSIEASGPVSIAGEKSKNVTFASAGEKPANFRLECDNSALGQARIVVKAASGAYRMSDTTFIEVQNPMPVLVDLTDRTLKPGQSATLTWTPDRTVETSLQIASMPAISFGGAMQFFEHYPHLCTEQLASKALFMLFGRQFLSAEDKARCEKVLPGVLKQLSARRMPDGGFSYWPGDAQPSSWATSMAGLALTEASRQGFSVDRGALERWTAFQQKQARDYRSAERSDLDQAFRLYTLVAAGQAMKPAMNRLRESKDLSQTAAYCLAAAYALEGRTDVAARLSERAERTDYVPGSGRFRSELCDEAFKVLAYALCKDSAKALPLARSIARECTGSTYVTQDLAFATMALRQLSAVTGSGSFSVTVAQKGSKSLAIQNAGWVKNLPLQPQSGQVEVTNTGKTTVDLSLTRAFRPSASEKLAPESKGLKIKVQYLNLRQAPIAVNLLRQDAEFIASISVENTGAHISSLALTYNLPSGWELWNSRLHGRDEKLAEYCDMRDNRVSYYTSLRAGQTKVFNIRLRAAYAGKFMLPPVVAEDMYNPSHRAVTGNSWVVVQK